MSTPQQPDFQQSGQPYGQPMGQQPPQAGPTQPAPPPATTPSKPKRFGWPVLAAAAFVALILGIAIGGAGAGSSTPAAAKPAPTVTVTQPAPAVTEGAGAPVTEPTEEPTEDTTDDTYSPRNSDFELGIKTLTKECFGSAGCNVSFRIKPSYVGSQALPTSGEIEVTYKITGLEDPFQNTFTVDGEGTITYTKEESGSTSSSGAKLKAKVTDVEYTP